MIFYTVLNQLVGEVAIALNQPKEKILVDMFFRSLYYLAKAISRGEKSYTVTSLGLPIPQVLKIDTQGCELSILKGCQENRSKASVLFLQCWLYRGYGKNTPYIDKIV